MKTSWSRQALRPALGLWLAVGATVVCRADVDAPRKHAEVAPLKGTITIDGKLDEGAWAQAPLHTGFEKAGLLKRETIPAEAQTEFRVLYDKEAVYVGIHCLEPHMDQLVVEAADVHDAAMWSDDDVELFIDPVGDGNEYYQFAINSRGTQVDLYLIERGNTGKGGWSADWDAEVSRSNNAWSLEIRLPFAALHNRPAETWNENWRFSMSRTRKPKPAYFSQFSPGTKYHDVDSFGTLGPFRIDRSRFNVCAESPEFRLQPADEGYAVFASVVLENRGTQEVKGTAFLEILTEGATGSRTEVTLAPGSSQRLSLPVASVSAEGKFPVMLRVRGNDGLQVLGIRFDEWLTYTPLSISITEPNYRNCIFATQTVDTIRGSVEVALPPEAVADCSVQVTLSSVLCPARTWEGAIGRAVAFEIPADDLPVGAYTVRAVVRRKGTQGKEGTLVAEVECGLRKLGRAPAVEIRVDSQGTLLVDGEPLFVRGWYGGMGYVRSRAAFPEAQLPRTTNFLMGATREDCINMGLYTLGGVTRRIDEAKAKLDQPIDDDLKARLREAMASARSRRNVIGYYISDEPECRGISPYYLTSLYEFMRQEDPFRMCLIVSRAPDVYMKACDVMCPHPYMNPVEYENGTRRLSGYLPSIQQVMRKAVAANDGARAVWCMPQTFSYGGPRCTHPNMLESRWFTFTALANGAKGIVPFIFNGYWNHYENRVAMDAVFEELALLAPAWMAPEAEAPVACSNNRIDAIAKRHRPEGTQRTHLYIVTANQSYDPGECTFDVPALRETKAQHLLVLRENRVVAVRDGVFSDSFGRLGVHIYTTLEMLPDLKTLADIQAQITDVTGRPEREGNLLAQKGVAWHIGGAGSNFSIQSDLCDGVTDAGGWLPWYGEKRWCEIVFAQPVTFSRVALHTPSIRDAVLEIDDQGEWKTIHTWTDQLLHRLDWEGAPVTTKRVRIHPTKARANYHSGAMNEITELGLYK